MKPQKTVGYYRITKSHKAFAKAQAKKKGFRTVSEYVDALLAKAKAAVSGKSAAA